MKKHDKKTDESSLKKRPKKDLSKKLKKDDLDKTQGGCENQGGGTYIHGGW